MSGAGRVLKVKRPQPDVGTVVRRLRVSMPLLKAVRADQGLLDLLLNHLVQAKVRRGQVIPVPVGAQVQEVSASLFREEQTLLAESREENYEEVAQQLQAGRDQYRRRVARSG